MTEKLTSNIKDVEFTSNTEKINYDKLITKLKEISETIFLLQKRISK